MTIPGTWIQGELRIPAGTLDGEAVSFEARGTRHHIRVKIEPDGVHQVQGRNLVREVQFRRREKPPGSEIVLSTPRGTVKLKVDAGTRTGTVWTVKGYGIPDPRGGPSGDLIATAVVEENRKPEPHPTRPASPPGRSIHPQEYTVTINEEESLQGTYRTVTIPRTGFQRRIRIPAGSWDGRTITFVAQGVTYQARVQIVPGAAPSSNRPAQARNRRPTPAPVSTATAGQDESGCGCLLIILVAGAILLVILAHYGLTYPGSDKVLEISGGVQERFQEPGNAGAPSPAGGRTASGNKFPGGGPLATDEIESWIIHFTNEERAKAGLHALAHDPAISIIARSHSQQMTRHGMHHEIGGMDPTDRAMAAGYDCRAYNPDGSYSYGLSENIIEYPRVRQWESWNIEGPISYWRPTHYYETTTEAARGMVTSWMNSPGHRANILDGTLSRIGVGVVARVTAQYGWKLETFFGTQNFSKCR